jgi:hypothetical protein
MVRLRQDSRANYVARKRLPDHIREEYGRLYGPTFEAKLSLPGNTKRREAERLFHEWLADVEAKIANSSRSASARALPSGASRLEPWYTIISMVPSLVAAGSAM